MSSDETVNVRYMVNDVAEAVTFYSTHFGFQVGINSPAFADATKGNLRLLLSGPMSSAGRPMPDGATPGPGGWNRIHFITTDLDGEIARLKARACRSETRSSVVPAGVRSSSRIRLGT